MTRVGLFLLLLASLAVGLHAQNTQSGGGKSLAKDGKDSNCGLLYGKAHALTFCAPDGWVLDNSVWNDQGIYAVFYPVGSTFDSAKDSATIMYINVAEKNDEKAALASMMADDAAEVKHNAPAAVVKEGEPIHVGDVKVPVQMFAPGAFDRYEAVAYLDSPKVLTMFVISSKNGKKFQKDYPAFAKLVQSYKFLSSNVTIKTK